MHITTIRIERPLGATFSVLATEGKSELIPKIAIDSLNKLTWESVIVKNYCLAINQQTDLRLEAIP